MVAVKLVQLLLLMATVAATAGTGRFTVKHRVITVS